MAVPSKACHLISLLLLLTAASANRRLLRDEVVCPYSTDDPCPYPARGGDIPGPGLVDSVCYPCVGVANNNLGGIVIGLPGINIAGIGIRFPTISIGNYGVQIGGYGGATGYMPGFGSSLCCDPPGGDASMPIAPMEPFGSEGTYRRGVPQEPVGSDRWGVPLGPGFGHHGYSLDSPKIPNLPPPQIQGSVFENGMKRQEIKGRNDHNKHVVKPKMGMGGQASVFKNEMQRWPIKGRNEDNKYAVRPKMETGKQENMGIKHVVKPNVEIRMHERKGDEGDKFVVKPKMQMAKQSNANNHGDEAREEYKKAYVSVHATPPMSN